MSNSSNIGYALIIGFIVYITVRGELPAYLCVIGIGTNCPPPGSSTTTKTLAAPPVSTSGVVNNAPASSPGFPNVFTSIIPTPWPTQSNTPSSSSSISFPEFPGVNDPTNSGPSNSGENFTYDAGTEFSGYTTGVYTGSAGDQNGVDFWDYSGQFGGL